MTVISDTYDMMAVAANLSPGYATGVHAVDYQTVTQDFLLYPYCDVFSDTVENDNQGWTVQLPWAITAESSHSPSHSWTDSPGGNYSNYLDKSITSQTFDLTGYSGISLSFWHKYVTEADWDFANVEYSTGTDWHSVATYDGNHNYWSQETINIPQLDGQTGARIRFHLTSDTNTVYDGWHVDNIAISGGGPGCISLSPPEAEFSSTSPVKLGQPIQFTNLSTGTGPMTYLWDFGDGYGTSSDANPAYIYSDTGTYTVTLTASNALGDDTISHPVSVEPVLRYIFLPLTVR
jgi:PKD repeat protein